MVILPRCPHYRRNNCVVYKLQPRACPTAKSHFIQRSLPSRCLELASEIQGGIKERTFNPSTQKTKTGSFLWTPVQIALNCNFQASQSYIVISCIKNKLILPHPFGVTVWTLDLVYVDHTLPLSYTLMAFFCLK